MAPTPPHRTKCARGDSPSFNFDEYGSFVLESENVYHKTSPAAPSERKADRVQQIFEQCVVHSKQKQHSTVAPAAAPRSARTQPTLRRALALHVPPELMPTSSTRSRPGVPLARQETAATSHKVAVRPRPPLGDDEYFLSRAAPTPGSAPPQAHAVVATTTPGSSGSGALAPLVVAKSIMREVRACHPLTLGRERGQRPRRARGGSAHPAGRARHPRRAASFAARPRVARRRRLAWRRRVIK